MVIIENRMADTQNGPGPIFEAPDSPDTNIAPDTTPKQNVQQHKRDRSKTSITLFEAVDDSLKKPMYGVLMKAPFFDSKNYEKGKGLFRKWTLKMFKFDDTSGVLSYCDAVSYQKSDQTRDVQVPTVMLGKCQYFHVGAGAMCSSVPEQDDVVKSEFVFRIEGLTGVHDKSLYLSSYTPEDRLKWITRISNYTQSIKLDQMKLREHEKMKMVVGIQDDQISKLQTELEDLIQLSDYLKNQVKKYQVLAGKMREDNSMLLDKLEIVSKEISGLRNSIKENSVSNQIQQLALTPSSQEYNYGDSSPEVVYLEKFSKYLDFKRNDIIRLSNRAAKRSPTTPPGPSTGNTTLLTPPSTDNTTLQDGEMNIQEKINNLSGETITKQ